MAKKTKPKDETPAADTQFSMENFEAALKELEALVVRMEKGEQNLEEALKDFERGVQLTRQCQTALQQAEQKVQQLISQGNRAELVPFDEDSET